MLPFVCIIRWHCKCPWTAPGDRVFLTGNHSRLGLWDPDTAIELATSSFAFPTWSTSRVCFLMAGGGSNFLEYKFFIMKAAGKRIWEEFPGNHRVELTGGTYFRITGDWNVITPTSMLSSLIPLSLFLNHPDSEAILTLKLNLDKEYEEEAKHSNCAVSGKGLHRWQYYDSGISVPDEDSSERNLVTEEELQKLAAGGGFSVKDMLTLIQSKLDKQGVTYNQLDISKGIDINLRLWSLGTTDIEPASAQPESLEEEEDETYVEPSSPKSSSPPPPSVAVPSRFRRDLFIVSNMMPVDSRYTVKHLLGRGTWGEVKLVEDRESGAYKADKRIPKCYVEDFNRLRMEIELMRTLDHPNIIRLYETFEDMYDVHLIMEYCSGGELFDRLINRDSFSEVLACPIMQQILAAVAFCHNHKVAHRDLKPENFLFLNETPESPLKLVDFGLASRFVPGRPMHTRAGTPYYVSPQVLDGTYGPECDEWSAGVIMYILLCGYPPFDAPSDRGIMSKIRVGQYSMNDAVWRNVSEDAKEVLQGLLTRHPKLRLTAEDALKCKWFTTNRPTLEITDRPLLDIVSKFRRFQGLSRLKKIVLTVIAQHIDEAMIDHLREVFIAMNTSGNGMLSREEIREAVDKSGVSLPRDIDDLIASVDTSGTGHVDYTEFIAACLARPDYIQEDACRAAFHVFDHDNDGKIDMGELRNVLITAGVEREETDAELQDAGLLGTEEISFDEFVNFIRKIPSRTLIGHNPHETVMMMRRMSSRPNVNPTTDPSATKG